MWSHWIDSLTKITEKVREILSPSDPGIRLAGETGGLRLENEYFAVRRPSLEGGKRSGSAGPSRPQRLDLFDRVCAELPPGSRKVLKSFNREELNRFKEYLREKSGVAGEILLHCLAESPGRDRKKWFDKIVKSSLDPNLLKGLVVWAGTGNLRYLSENLQMRWPSDGDVDALRSLQIAQGKNLSRVSRSIRATQDGVREISESLPLCVGLSGQRHYDAENLVFLSLNGKKGHPDAALGYVDGTLNLFEALQPDRFGPREAKERAGRSRGKVIALLNALGFENLVSLDEPTKAVGYTYATRDIELYQKVHQLVDSLAIDLARMPRKRGELAALTESLHRILEPSGQPLQWCESKIQADPKSVPEEIRLAVKEVRQPTSEEASHLAHAALVTYYLLHQFVSKEVALSNCASVVREFEQLAHDDPLRKEYGAAVASGLARVSPILNKPQFEVSVSEVQQVYAAIPVDSLGAELNRRALERDGRGFQEVPARFAPFFFTDENRWQEYCRGGKIGQKEFYQTVYGRKYGGARDGVRVLSVSELQTIRDAVLLQRAHPDERRMLRVMAPTEFRAMLRDLNIILAKVNAVDGAIERAGVSLSRDPRTSPSWLVPGAALEGKFIRPPLSGECVLEEDAPFPETTPLTVREILARARSREAFVRVTHPDSASSAPSAFPANPQAMERLRAMAVQVKDDRPVAEFQSLLDDVSRLLEHPLVTEKDELSRIRSREFLTPGDVVSLQDVLAVGQVLKREKLDRASLTQGEYARLEDLFGKNAPEYYSLIRPDGFDPMRYSLFEMLGKKGVAVARVATKSGNPLVEYFGKKAELFHALTELKGAYVPAVSLPVEWGRRAVEALGPAHEQRRKQISFPWVSPSLPEYLGNLLSNPRVMFSREMTQKLSRLIADVDKPFVPSISRFFEVKRGALVIKFPSRKAGKGVAEELSNEKTVFGWILWKNSDNASKGQAGFPPSVLRFCRAAVAESRKLQRLPVAERSEKMQDALVRLKAIYEEGLRSE